MRRNPSEPVADLFKRFNKIYNKMPPDCKPLVTSTKDKLSKSFEDDFVVMLREIKSKTLADMKTNAIEVEENRSSFSKLKANAEKAERKIKSRGKNFIIKD